uniref:Uncharacterized protein n=1 Tax=Arundo donax TaxID=35708 RepID=A0A0A9G8M1_ARUDO
MQKYISISVSTHDLQKSQKLYMVVSLTKFACQVPQVCAHFILQCVKHDEHKSAMCHQPSPRCWLLFAFPRFFLWSSPPPSM